jgi:hypothetical protein
LGWLRFQSTYQTGNIDTILLVTTAHGKVLIKRRQLSAGVTLRNSLLLLANIFTNNEAMYIEQLDVVEEVVVESEIVAGDDLDTSILLDLPVLQPQAAGLLDEVLL